MEYNKGDQENFDSEVAEQDREKRSDYLYEDEEDLEYDEPYDATSLVEQVPETRKKGGIRGFLSDLIFYGVLIFVCIYIIPNFIMQRTIVDGSSMENTLSDGDNLYVEKISYRFDKLKRFDIIVFYPYGRENEEYYVKRIIGMPGETIQIIGSDIYINGEVLEENYGKDPIEDPGRAAIPITLGEDEYFVMGDNRTISKDSRFSVVGNVKKDNIGGRAFFRITPFRKFGTID